MKEILDVIHKTIYQFFDVYGDDEEVPMSDKDKLLLKVNKAICNNLKALEQQPCEDAISRQAVLGCLTATKLKKFDFILHAREEIKKLPPVTPQPKTGHWIDRFPTKECKCSVCDFLICISNGSYIDMVGQMKYCPNCGAKMAERSGEDAYSDW